MKKTFVLGIVLSLSSVIFAGTKSYQVVFTSAAKIGSVKLAPGEYSVKVDGANAVFTNNTTSKKVTTPVKVETGTKKFQFTAVDSTKNADGETVKAIELGGSTTTLEF
jgi:hypothetical protein